MTEGSGEDPVGAASTLDPDGRTEAAPASEAASASASEAASAPAHEVREVAESVFDVGPADAFAEDSITPIELGDTDVVVIRQDGAFYALPDRCTHARFPLHDGELLDGKIKCVHHGATFDLKTGRPTLPAVKKLKLYTAAEEDDRVVVTLQQS